MHHSKTPQSNPYTSVSTPGDSTAELATHNGVLSVAPQQELVGGAFANIQFLSTNQATSDQAFYCELSPLSDSVLGESWQCLNEPVQRGVSGAVNWSVQGGFLFVGLSRPWTQDTDMTVLTKNIYLDLLAVVRSFGDFNVVRCWNYVPNINGGVELGNADDEVYKRFCTGRLQAFDQLDVGSESYPSASAVGHHGSSLTVHILANRMPVAHLGNDQQVEAFNYPRQYGKSSPSFARATQLQTNQQELLFISGTASIIGHASQCQGDLVGQLSVTLDNIRHLLVKAGKTDASVSFVRVYLRRAEDLAVAQEFLDRGLPTAARVILLADICRAELLVEIECVCV